MGLNGLRHLNLHRQQRGYRRTAYRRHLPATQEARRRGAIAANNDGLRHSTYRGLSFSVNGVRVVGLVVVLRGVFLQRQHRHILPLRILRRLLRNYRDVRVGTIGRLTLNDINLQGVRLLHPTLLNVRGRK